MRARDPHDMPYRPPLREDRWTGGSKRPALRFFARYLRPHRTALAAAILLLSLHACSGYLLAYYTRIVVDRILVVRADEPGAGPGRWEASTAGHGRRRAAERLPRRGEVSEVSRTRESSPRPPGAARSLAGMFAIYLLTLAAVNAAARGAVRLRMSASRELTRRLRDDLHRQALSLSKAYHERHPPGRLLARILSDVDVLRQQLMQTIMQGGSHFVMIAVGLALLASVDVRMAGAFVVILGPYAALVHWFQERMIPVHRETRHTNSCMYGYATQKLDGIRAVFAYGREAHERLVFQRLSHGMLRDVLTHERYAALLNLCGALITSTATLGLFLAGTGMVLGGDLTLGEMLFAYSVTATLFAPVVGLTQLTAVTSSLFVLAQRLTQLLEERPDLREEPGAVNFPEPLQAGLRMRHVRFTHRTATTEALRGVSLDIPVGQWCCIMGPSGGGKSTLLHLLSRLYDPDSGTISVDGIPLSNLRFSSLRHHMALVPQEAQIFTGTVRDNITYGRPDATPSEIMAAARAAECHDFIMELPIQYETLVGERGATLSGGQRQRISMARALLTRPDVLLLDDVTSALDADTEHRIQETLAGLMQGKTAVIVTQRVSMARRCHRIVLLDEGVIVEEGAHDELLEQNGVYAQLVRQQTG
jgi:ATP-binding cassette, subfamily B, bacterial